MALSQVWVFWGGHAFGMFGLNSIFIFKDIREIYEYMERLCKFEDQGGGEWGALVFT